MVLKTCWASTLDLRSTVKTSVLFTRDELATIWKHGFEFFFDNVRKTDKHIPLTTSKFISLGNTCCMFRQLLAILRY